MTDYINAVKRGFRDVHHFVPTGGTEEDPLFAEGTVPDGTYPMEIDGKMDYVRMEDGRIYCCQFDAPAEQPQGAA